MTSFREAMDLLCLGAEDVAEMMGAKAQTVRQWRMDPDRDGYRPPPEDWRQRFAPIARRRGQRLAQLADELEAK